VPPRRYACERQRSDRMTNSVWRGDATVLAGDWLLFAFVGRNDFFPAACVLRLGVKSGRLPHARTRRQGAIIGQLRSSRHQECLPRTGHSQDLCGSIDCRTKCSSIYGLSVRWLSTSSPSVWIEI
jgi:hypothetical protein